MPGLVAQTRLMWGMPITVAIVEPPSALGLMAEIFAYFETIDGRFSTYKPDSEISRINRGALTIDQASADMRTVLDLAEEMRLATDGYFDIARDGTIDPSGLVKGWALSNAANMLRDAGCADFCVEAGGDFQAAGGNAEGRPWRVGIRNPFRPAEIVKVLVIRDRGVATSGTYIRGQHIYNPVTGGPTDGDPKGRSAPWGAPDPEILSLTVIGPDVYEADCYATAAFAMGRSGLEFIKCLPGFEGYLIDSSRRATFTRGFERYVDHAPDR